MDDSLLQFTITAFVMLVVVINPVAVAPVFVSVTRGRDAAGRRAVLNRAVVVAYCVTLFLGGELSPLAERSVVEKLGDALPRGTARFFPGVGHMGPISHAPVVNEAMVAHLGAV